MALERVAKLEMQADEFLDGVDGVDCWTWLDLIAGLTGCGRLCERLDFETRFCEGRPGLGTWWWHDVFNLRLHRLEGVLGSLSDQISDQLGISEFLELSLSPSTLFVELAHKTMVATLPLKRNRTSLNASSAPNLIPASSASSIDPASELCSASSVTCFDRILEFDPRSRQWESHLLGQSTPCGRFEFLRIPHDEVSELLAARKFFKDLFVLHDYCGDQEAGNTHQQSRVGPGAHDLPHHDLCSASWVDSASGLNSASDLNSAFDSASSSSYSASCVDPAPGLNSRARQALTAAEAVDVLRKVEGFRLGTSIVYIILGEQGGAVVMESLWSASEKNQNPDQNPGEKKDEKKDDQNLGVAEASIDQDEVSEDGSDSDSSEGSTVLSVEENQLGDFPEKMRKLHHESNIFVGFAGYVSVALHVLDEVLDTLAKHPNFDFDHVCGLFGEHLNGEAYVKFREAAVSRFGGEYDVEVLVVDSLSFRANKITATGVEEVNGMDGIGAGAEIVMDNVQEEDSASDSGFGQEQAQDLAEQALPEWSEVNELSQELVQGPGTVSRKRKRILSPSSEQQQQQQHQRGGEEQQEGEEQEQQRRGSEEDSEEERSRGSSEEERSSSSEEERSSSDEELIKQQLLVEMNKHAIASAIRGTMHAGERLPGVCGGKTFILLFGPDGLQVENALRKEQFNGEVVIKSKDFPVWRKTNRSLDCAYMLLQLSEWMKQSLGPLEDGWYRSFWRWKLRDDRVTDVGLKQETKKSVYKFLKRVYMSRGKF